MFGFMKRQTDAQAQHNDMSGQLKTALDCVQDLVLICDAGQDGTVLHMNRRAHDVLGRSGGLGGSVHRMYPDANQSRQAFEDIRSRRAQSSSWDVHYGDMVFRTRVSPVWDERDSSKLVSFAVSWQDITLESQNEHLQKQAAAKQQLQGQVEQIASAVEAVSTSVGEVASHAFQSLERADNVLSSVQRGKDVVQDVVEEMQRIAGLVRSTADSVQKLGTQSERIGVVVGVIKEIADQTNLLALNAAIEAARAGEAGRGFAVVADEVRKLSERTAKATSEISGTIQTIQSDIQSAVGAMGSGQERVVAGEQKASTANDALDVIVHDMQAMRDLICDISRAVEQQAGASTDVSKRLEVISAMD